MKSLLDQLKDELKGVANRIPLDYELDKTQSFTKPTKELHHPGLIVLTDTLKGNIVVRSDQEIQISRNAVLENTLIVAPKIYVQDGFTGSMQIIATDSVTIDERVTLSFPSSISVINDSNKEAQTIIELKSKSKIEGTILSVSKLDSPRHAAIHIHEEAEVEGMVYTNTRSEIRGTVNGTLITNNLTVRTASSIYDNHLYSGVIDQTERNDHFLNGYVFENKKSEILKWLN